LNNLFLSVTGSVSWTKFSERFCVDCKPSNAEYNNLTHLPYYRCPHENCNKKFKFREFFEHLKTTCGPPKTSPTVNIEGEINRHEREIKRLQELKVADVKKAIRETKMKKEKESREIERLINNQELFDRQLIDLEAKLRALTTSAQNQPRNDEIADSCGVCLENYDNENCQRACIINCMHYFCFRCLNALNSKICPKCRMPFNNAQIRKIY